MPAADLRTRALRLLARREYTARELAARLERAGGDAEAVAALVATLREAGYLSDRRFAESMVRSQQGRFGRRYIAQALEQKGVDRELAREALAGIEQDDLTAARALWQRRFGTLPRDDRERARQLRFLHARGFLPALVLRIWREQRAEADDDDRR